ncbi:MAG: hypothetical protein K0S37_472 [Microbacterium sp.]|jgi:serine/threonine-protein kinase HipA|nr:hypothetical protein [Microbacterium sp.]
MTDSLDVYLYGTPVATIERRGANMRLHYVSAYVESPRPVPISVQLPVVNGPAPAEITRRFLENLLPDRPDVRSRWAREAKLTSDSTFDLLSVYGADVAGALEFYPSGSVPRSATTLSEVDEQAIGQRIRRIREDDSDWLNQRAAEEGFSLGGAHGKFALASVAGRWFEPTGRHPSTHIFKPGVRALNGSDVTEHITMRVANQLGLIVPDTAVEVFDGEHTLIVERFDRFFSDGAYHRLHQEDMAQATGTSHLNKYEADGGPGYRDLFRLFERDLTSGQARAAKTRFAESLIFAWIIGHNDGHSKNYSLTHLPEQSFLSPFYDLNSALPFQSPGVVRSKDYRAFDRIQLAFTVAGAGTIGAFGIDSIRVLEHDAELPEGHLRHFALRAAGSLPSAVAEAIDTLPAALRELPPVVLYPYAAYAQSIRVRDLLNATL